MTEINNNTFDIFITQDGIVIVIFSADWCPQCKTLEPKLEEISKQYGKGIYIAKVNLDHSQMVAERFSITSIPVLHFYKNGDLIEIRHGVSSNLQGAIDTFIRENL
jgi:thioredoxin 1